MFFINVSGATIGDPGFPEFLQLILKEYGVSGAVLELLRVHSIFHLFAPRVALEDIEVGDEKIGAQIVRKAIEEPLRTLCFNAGVEGAVVVAQVVTGKGGHGYNVATGEFEDLIKAGVVDPTKVARIALQNSASIAGLLLTTEAVVSELPEKKEAPAMPPGGGMDGMM